jgi:hypothetical protein
MVQVPPNIEVSKKRRGDAAAAYLEGIVNQQAADGWEFYRTDSFGVEVPSGCLAALFGKRASYSNYYVITFRRPD